MSMSFGKTSKKGSTNQQQDPWEPVIPYLTDYLSQVGNLGEGGATAGQTDAYNKLSGIYAQGNPNAGKIEGLANETLAGVPSQSGTVTDAYGSVKSALTPYVNGENLDFANNPYIQGLLTQVGDDAAQRVNAQFAGAGRDMSGMNSLAGSRGVAQATTPILAQLFNQAQDRQLQATNQLMGAANTTATTAQGLDQAALTAKAHSVPSGSRSPTLV